MGLAQQVSPQTGFTVAMAVIAHDFCDGLNTVSLMSLHRNERSRTRRMLILNAIAPVLGALATLGFSVPADTLVLYLAFFAGSLLYIGASDILPQAHSGADSAAAMNAIGLMVLGASCSFLVMRATS